MDYTITRHGDETSITLFHEGKGHFADSSHPNFEPIHQGLLNDDESIIDLFDLQRSIAKKFERLSERVTVANGNIYFDGDEIDNAVTKHILRCLEENASDLSAHVNFLEKVQQNPVPESVTELYDWLNSNKFTLTSEGDIVAYKGVKDNYLSSFAGTAIVDGEVITGHIPNHIGSIIEMPRSEVIYDPSKACNVGLHASSFEFAKNWSNRTLLIHVNPRDVVSVPHKGAQKMRVCRYKVVLGVTEELMKALVQAEEEKKAPACCECGGDENTCTCDSWTSTAPTQREFNKLKALAKQRKRGFERTAKQHGWKLVGSNPLLRENWSIVKGEK